MAFRVHLIMPRTTKDCHSTNHYNVKCMHRDRVVDRGECTQDIEKVTCGMCVPKGMLK